MGDGARVPPVRWSGKLGTGQVAVMLSVSNQHHGRPSPTQSPGRTSTSSRPPRTPAARAGAHHRPMADRVSYLRNPLAHRRFGPTRGSGRGQNRNRAAPHERKAWDDAVVPVLPELRRALESWIGHMRRRWVLTPDLPLFLSREDNPDATARALSRHTARRTVHHAFARAGIGNDGRLGTHTLRKTWARNVYRNSGTTSWCSRRRYTTAMSPSLRNTSKPMRTQSKQRSGGVISHESCARSAN